MDIARFFIERRTISWMFTLILVAAGISAFVDLGRLEDPKFTIKEALIVAQYPGASPKQVEEELALPIENALQQLVSVKRIESYNSAGLTQVLVEMKEQYRETELRQIWDELRRKISDLTPQLPPGAGPIQVYDDFGDVFGVLLGVTGDGFEQSDISDYVDVLRRDLVLVDGVGKVSIQGERLQQIVVEMSQSKLSNLGISPQQIALTLNAQNQISNAGQVAVGSELIRLHPTGEFQNVSDLANLIISNPGQSELTRLGDVANIRKEYQEVPFNITRYNAKPGILVGLSFAPGINVIDVGKRVEAKIQELQSEKPQGIDIETIYQQHVEVEKSVDSFVWNLAAAVAIVFLVLLVFMGLRAGALIGFVLFVTVVGSFIFMKQMDIELQRISLGALIIALGMLVDNAIVVVEGMLIGLKRGLNRAEAASQIVKQTQLPLLGATLIAIIAFAPIGLSSDATGEFAGSLFWVLLISLLLSWVTAITITPFFGSMVFRETVDSEAKAKNAEPQDDPYQGVIFTVFRTLLGLSLRNRAMTMLLTAVLLASSIVGFAYVKQSFFPPSTTPIFILDAWHKEGTDIRVNSDNIKKAEAILNQNPHVEQVTTTIGQGLPRFTLTYDSEKSYASYAQMVVKMVNGDELEKQLPGLVSHIQESLPDVEFIVKRLEIGPATKAKIEARFSGPDPKVLRDIADTAMQIIESHPDARNVRHNWRQTTKIIRPEFDEPAGRRVGVTKQDIDDQLLVGYGGKTVGLYRENSDLLPIVMRTPIEERGGAEGLSDVQVFSRTHQTFIPITQVVNNFKVEHENPLIIRRDRKRTVTVLADNNIFGEGTATALFKDLKPQIEAIELPVGYQMKWGGEHEASSNAEAAVASSLPVGYLVMFIITVLLFNSLRSALAVWVTVPLAVIGVTFGLLVTQQAFGFMALLGLLSLTGMMIKNGIVLVEQVNIELELGMSATQALVEATVSRVRPVSMAAITTILGMIPLLFDNFFASMSVAIMFGLGFATVFTLIVVPVAYALIYKIRFDDRSPPLAVA